MVVFNRCAVVTGSNKGIGFEIVKELCKTFDGDVFLTARNMENGQKAVEKLNQLGLEAKFYELDILNHQQIINFAIYLRKNYGGIDILVNNAGIAYRRSDNLPLEKFVDEVLMTNFIGHLNVCNSLFPLLRSNARVVNISSRLGHLHQIKSKLLRERFIDPELNINGLIDLMDQYVRACHKNIDKKLGYPQSNLSSYIMSKLAINILTPMQQAIFDADKDRTGIVVSCVCPGYCKTDLTLNKGPISPAEGAKTAILLWLLDEDWIGPKGAFWAENREIDWIKFDVKRSIFPILKKILNSNLKSLNFK